MKKIEDFLDKNEGDRLRKMMLENPIIFAEVGAARGGQRFSDISSFVEYYGFEPDAPEAKKLEDKLNETSHYKKVKIFPTAITEVPGPVSINITKKTGCSSILEPNSRLIRGFSSRRKSLTPWPQFFEVTGKYDCQGANIDKIATEQQIPRIDFLGLDTQGTEYGIMKGGREMIQKTTLMLHVEMEVLPLYTDQRLLGEIISLMADYGFRLLGIENPQLVSRKPADRNDILDRGELISIDGLFCRDTNDEFWSTFGKDDKTILRYMMLLKSLGFLTFSIYLGRQYLEKQGNNSAIDSLARALEGYYFFENDKKTPYKIRLQRKLLAHTPRKIKDLLKKVVY